MQPLTRLAAVAASVLSLSLWSVTQASAAPSWPRAAADAELPTTITLHVPSSATPGAPATTITIEVRPTGAITSSEVRVASDADPQRPTAVGVSVGDNTVGSIAVDTRHPFIWTVSTATVGSVGCGPHPTAAAPGCPPPDQPPATTQPAAPAVAAPPITPANP